MVVSEKHASRLTVTLVGVLTTVATQRLQRLAEKWATRPR